MSNITRIHELIGRERELKRIERAISDIRKEGQVLLITGDAGSGKSTLVNNALRHARLRQLTPILVNCDMPHGATALHPWLQVIRQLDKSTPHSAAIASVMQKSAAIKQLFIESRLANQVGSPRLERIPLWLGFNRLFLEASKSKPIVLILEDVDRIDDASRQLLDFIANGLVYPEILLILTQRTGSLAKLSDPISMPLTDDDAHYEHLTLSSLSESDIEKLALRVNPAMTQAQLHQLNAIAEGNPLFVSEYCQQLGSGVVDNFSDNILGLITARIGALKPNVVEALQLASVLGREFRLTELIRLAPEGKSDLRNILDQAMVANLIELVNEEVLLEKKHDEEETFYRFSHTLIQEVVGHSISEPIKKRLHLQIAFFLIDNKEVAAEEVIAQHLRLAGNEADPELVIQFSLKAASSARNHLAYDVAIRHLTALIEMPRLALDAQPGLNCDINLRLGECYLQTLGVEAARKFFHKAHELAKLTQNNTSSAAAVLGLSGGMQPLLGSGALTLSRDIQLALETLETKSSHDAEENVLKNRLRSRLVHFLRPISGEVIALAQVAIDEAREIPDDECLLHAMIAKHALLVNPAFAQERLDLSDQIRLIGQSSVNRDLIVMGYLAGFSDCIAVGNIKVALQIREELSAKQPKALFQGDVARMSAACSGLAGDFEQAANLAESVSTSALGSSLIRAMQMFQIRRAQQRLNEMQPFLEAMSSRYPDQQTVLVHRSLCCAELGQRSKAQQIFDRLAINDFADLPEDPSWKSSFVALVEICCILRDSSRAKILILKLQAFENCHLSQGSNWYYGAGAFFLALLNHLIGEQALAESLIDKAVIMHEEIGALPMISRSKMVRTKILADRS